MLAGIGTIVVVAGAGAAIYVVGFHPASPSHPAALPTKVDSYQTVGLIAVPAQPTGQSAQLLQLLSPQGVPSFTQVGQAQEVSGQPEWNADLMSDGTYIFIYVPTGQCLASAGPASRAHLSVQRCDLGLRQRWRRLGGAISQGGHQFYQFANAASGKCISQVSGLTGQSAPAGLASCDPAHPQSELLAFWWTTQ